jgi:hypothetical protein
MSESANVRSIEALRNFEIALVKFQDTAGRAGTNLQQQSRRMIQWLELDRPIFWKRQLELAHQQLAEARTRLTQCKMRRTGDFRPSCYDEKKALDAAKHNVEYCRRQIEVVKQWTIKARSEAEEFTGRQAQLSRMLDGEVPKMCALMQRMVAKLEQYATITTADTMAVVNKFVAEDTTVAAAVTEPTDAPADTEIETDTREEDS